MTNADRLVRMAERLEAEAVELRKMADNEDRNPSRAGKLSAADVLYIKTSKESDSDLARKFDVTRGTVWSVRNGVSHRSTK